MDSLLRPGWRLRGHGEAGSHCDAIELVKCCIESGRKELVDHLAIRERRHDYSVATFKECVELALVRGDVAHGVPIEMSSRRRVQHHDLFAKKKRLALPLLQHFDQPLAAIELRARRLVDIAAELR